MKTEIKKLPKSEIEIQFELTAEEFEKHFQKALEYFKEHVKMDGFRKGQVPAKMVEEKVKPEELLMEAGDIAVKAVYPKFVEENKLQPIGDPEVQIKKIAKGNEFLFTVKVAVLPEIKLPDYKEIASKIKAGNVEVTEKEIQETIDYLQKSRAKFTTEDRPAKEKDFVEIEYSNKDINGGKVIKDRFIMGQGGFLEDFEQNVIGMKAGEEKEFSAKFPDNTPRKDLAGKNADFKVKMLSVQKMELAPVDDEFAKSLGAFDTLVALKENLKEGITLEKIESEKQRSRAEMLEKISTKTEFDIPAKMVEYEQARLLDELKVQAMNRFSALGGPASGWENYLASVKKTEEEMKATYKLEAEKRIKNFLVLREIGKAENVEVTDQEIQEEMQKITKRQPFDSAQGKIDIGRLTEYSKGALFNEKVFVKLESFTKI